MKNGYPRFEHHLQKLETLIKQSQKDPNPALWLAGNDARTPLFMLEGLCRLYGKLHTKKTFSKLGEQFKALEDGFGQVDYYSSYAKIFLQHTTVPVHVREYMQAQTREKLQHVNDLLAGEGWIGKKPKRFKKIRKKLKAVNWLKASDEAKAIKALYKEEAKAI
ncbi:MAG: hypothetical protein EOO03_18060, partial [Chitinophagaceae bacterium]